MSGFPANDAASTDAESTRLLAVMARRIAASLDLRETLRIVAASVVDQLGFGCAVVNMTRPGDLCEVVAVAGSPEAAAALLGTCAPMDTWRKLLADCEPWGELRFLDHRSDQRHARSIAGWVPPVDPPGGRRPDARRRQLLEQFAVHAALAIEHARAHTFLARSEQLFRAMFDRSPIAIALLTEDERITRVNEAFEKLLGRDSAALLGRTATELRRPDSVPARRGTDAAGPPAGQYEIHFTRPDGRPVWGRVNSTLLATRCRPRPS